MEQKALLLTYKLWAKNCEIKMSKLCNKNSDYEIKGRIMAVDIQNNVYYL